MGTEGGLLLSTAVTGPTTTDAVVERLRGFSRLEAPTHVEEQTYLETAAGAVFATAVEPTGSPRGAAFLTCHSFAWEQFELHPLELAFARAAAAAGFPSLLPQARGYGDSGGPFAEVTPATHVREAVAAAGSLGERTGLPVVPVGPRLGAAVALATAIRTGAPGVVLWDPPERPSRYFQALLRALQVAGVSDEEGEVDAAAPPVAEVKRALEEGRTVDVFGYPLTAECYAEGRAMDPLGAGTAPPRALIVTVNPVNRGSAQRLASRMRELGSDVRVDEADGPGRGDFGLGIPRAGHLATHLDTFRDIARRTLAWAGEAW